MILCVVGKENFACPEGAVCIRGKHWADCISIGVAVYSEQKYQLLKLLEREYKNIVVSSNLFLDEDVRAAIVSGGGEIIELSDGEPLQLNPKFLNSGKVVNDMSIEDSIKKAMEELGMNPDELETELPDNPSVLTSDEPEKVDTPAEFPPNLPDNPPSTVEVSKPLNEEKIEPNTNIYLKIKNGTVALFIPDGAQLSSQVVDGKSYKTIVFRAPDLGNTGLQELKQVAQVKQPVRVPITNDSSLVELVKEKASLDEQIRIARSENDEELVKQLRKQRRQVRERINYWGLQS